MRTSFDCFSGVGWFSTTLLRTDRILLGGNIMVGVRVVAGGAVSVSENDGAVDGCCGGH